MVVITMKTSLLDFASIKHKILFFGGIALLLVAIGIIGYTAFTMNASAVSSAKSDLQSTAEREGVRVQAVLEEPLTTTSGIAAIFAGLRDENAQFPRSDVVSMMQGILRDRPIYNGVYTIWEPQIFDAKDEIYKLKDGYDKTGRLRVYWYRDASGQLIRKIYDETSKDPGSYYDVPKTGLKGAIIEPYVETLQGSPVLLASLVAPIVRDGKFNGIVGVDVTISDIEKITDSLNIYQGAGKSLVVSNGGIVVGATGNKDAAGKPLKDVVAGLGLNAETIQDAITADEIRSFDNGKLLGSIVPIRVGNTETPWAVVVYAPTSVVTANATTQTLMLILIGIIISAIGMGLLYLVARSIASPISHITDVSLKLADGDLSTHIGIHQRDEVGRLADAFRHMREGMQGKAEVAAHIARGDLNVTVPVASDKDLLGRSMIQMKDAITAMTGTMNNLSERASAGDLSIRGDTNAFSGEYAHIVSGVNATLDAVISPLNEGMRLAGEFSSNNFKARFDPAIPVSGDFIRFRDAMDDIGVQVSGTIHVINGKMAELIASAEEAQASTNEVTRGASEVAQNAESVSHYADKGSDGTSQVLKAMEDLSMAVSDISVKTEQVSRLAEESNQLSNEGQVLAKTAGDGMDGIRTATSDIAEMIRTIKGEMDQITSVIAIITSISDETNLLALNAAIEAARAGEAGRGFAVVAEEVKQLAMESHQSAEKIEEMIKSLGRESARATEVMERAQTQVGSGYSAVQKTLGIFSRIVDMLYDITKNISEVAAASEEQAAAVQEITASITEVHQMIRSTAENAVSNAAISEESAAAVDQIQRVLENVNSIVAVLQNEINKFSI